MRLAPSLVSPLEGAHPAPDEKGTNHGNAILTYALRT